jgi:hypothetical protein
VKNFFKETLAHNDTYLKDECKAVNEEWKADEEKTKRLWHASPFECFEHMMCNRWT